jgi:hypothetical protein
MMSASNGQEFERAAALRDKWETLKWLQKNLERMRMARERLSFVYSVAGVNDRNLWYLIRHGHIVSVLPAPDKLELRRVATEIVEKQFCLKKSRSLLPAPEAIDQVLLVAAWFHRHPRERARTIKPDELLARCRKCQSNP